MAFTRGDQRTVWSRLMDELGLAGLNAGEHRTTSARPEELSGIVHLVHQDDRKRYALLRLDAPAGVAMLGTFGMGENVNVSAIIFFYGDDAAEKSASQRRPLARLVG